MLSMMWGTGWPALYEHDNLHDGHPRPRRRPLRADEHELLPPRAEDGEGEQHRGEVRPHRRQVRLAARQLLRARPRDRDPRALHDRGRQQGLHRLEHRVPPSARAAGPRAGTSCTCSPATATRTRSWASTTTATSSPGWWSSSTRTAVAGDGCATCSGSARSLRRSSRSGPCSPTWTGGSRGTRPAGARGELVVGSVVRMKLKLGRSSMPMKQKIVEVTAPSVLRWQSRFGPTWLFLVTRTFRLEPVGEGRSGSSSPRSGTGLLSSLDLRVHRAAHRARLHRHRGGRGPDASRLGH